MCTGTVSGVFRINSKRCGLAYGQQQTWSLPVPQLEAAFSTGEVTKVGKRGCLGVMVVVLRPKVKGGLCSAV